MSKTIGTLEKEMLMWKGRYEKCNKSLLDMAQEVCTITMAMLTRGGALNGVYDVSTHTHTAHGDGTKCTATQNQE